MALSVIRGDQTMINPDANIKSQRRDWLLKRQEYLREQYRTGPLPTKALVDELERIYEELKDVGSL